MRTIAIVMMSLLVAMVAFAGDHGPECTGDCCSTKFMGFVDAAYVGYLEQASHDFSVDQAEIDVIRKVDNNIVVRADVEWYYNGATWATNVEQAYVHYRLPVLPRVTFRFGKFNAPIGLEAVDAPDMYQYSHSLVYTNLLPTNLTGVMAKAKLNKQMYVKLYVANGWDMDRDNNEAKTAGGRVGFYNDKFHVGLSGIMGTFDNDQDFMRTVYDVDVTFNATEQLMLGGEFNMGTISSDLNGVDDQSWTGFLVKAHYTFTEMYGLTVRYDMVDDADGYNFGTINGDGYSRSSLTVAPTFDFGHGMGAVLEYRMDMAGEDVFLDADNKPTGSNSMVALEMVYTF